MKYPQTLMKYPQTFDGTQNTRKTFYAVKNTRRHS